MLETVENVAVEDAPVSDADGALDVPGVTSEDRDPEPPSEEKEAHRLWRERRRKRKQRAAATARALADSADAADAASEPVTSPLPAPSPAQASAARVRRGRPRGSRNKGTTAPVTVAEPGESRARLEREAAELCAAMAKGLLTIIPPEMGGGTPEPDATQLGAVWGPVAAPYLADAGDGKTSLYVALGFTLQIVLVRAIGAYRLRAVPSGYTVRAPDEAREPVDLDREAAELAARAARGGDGVRPAGLDSAGYSPND